MRKLTFVFIFILNAIQGLQSQDYVPFSTENVNWNVYYVGTCEERAPDTTLLRYTIYGDTIINEVLYKKLCLESGDTISPKIKAIGGLREENKKVYYSGETILAATDGEYLLYDFTKEVGDTIFHNSQGGFYSVILDIDSVLIESNYRKRYKTESHSFGQSPDYIVEGIGSILNGLLGNISDIPTCGTHYWEHICFKENGEVKYMNPSFNDCFPHYVVSKVKQIHAESNIIMYPNPVSGELTLENLTSNKNLMVKIMDMKGSLLKQQIINNGVTKVTLPDVSGILNVFVVNEKGQILKAEKMVKE